MPLDRPTWLDKRDERDGSLPAWCAFEVIIRIRLRLKHLSAHGVFFYD